MSILKALDSSSNDNYLTNEIRKDEENSNISDINDLKEEAKETIVEDKKMEGEQGKADVEQAKRVIEKRKSPCR